MSHTKHIPEGSERETKWRCPACRAWVTEPMHRQCCRCRRHHGERDIETQITAAEQRIEAGQARWSATGRTWA